MGVELPLCVVVTLSQNVVFSGVKLSMGSFILFGDSANWNIQCKLVGLPTKCSIELLVMETLHV